MSICTLDGQLLCKVLSMTSSTRPRTTQPRQLGQETPPLQTVTLSFPHSCPSPVSLDSNPGLTLRGVTGRPDLVRGTPLFHHQFQSLSSSPVNTKKISPVCIDPDCPEEARGRTSFLVRVHIKNETERMFLSTIFVITREFTTFFFFRKWMMSFIYVSPV